MVTVADFINHIAAVVLIAADDRVGGDVRVTIVLFVDGHTVTHVQDMPFYFILKTALELVIMIYPFVLQSVKPYHALFLGCQALLDSPIPGNTNINRLRGFH